MSREVEKFRKDCMVNDVKRDEGLTTPKGVERFDDIRYGPDEKWNVLDVYRPKAEEKRLPVIVSVHGGGWVYGDKELYQFYCMSLAERGFAVVNFTYRLAPEHKYPAPLEDINRVMEWIFQNEAQYGFDLKSVFLVGDSAGAHLAGIYSCICTNRTYASAYSFQVPEGFVPKALALNCGVYAPIPTGEAPVLEHEQVNDLPKEFMPEGGTLEEAELIDLTRHITSDFPPVLFMTATEDFCRPQAAYLEKALKAHQVPFVFKLYGTKQEALHHVFHLNVRDETGKRCNDEECAYFRKFL